jgi:hypothetical protein
MAFHTNLLGLLITVWDAEKTGKLIVDEAAPKQSEENQQRDAPQKMNGRRQ